MEHNITSGGSLSGRPGRVNRVGEPLPPDDAIEEVEPAEEPRVTITLGVSDGFRFGCGLLLAGIAFYFGVILVVAVALLVAALLGLPLPFGLGGG
jgi:hypothetical protein